MADGTGALGDTLIPAINRIQDIFSQVGSYPSLHAISPCLKRFYAPSLHSNFIWTTPKGIKSEQFRR